MSFNVNVANTWHKINATYANVSSTWRHVPQIYVNVNGTWRPLWSYSWNPLAWGSCSATCGGGTQTRVVQCLRNDGTVWDASVCTKLIGANPHPTSQACNTHSCIPCYYVSDVGGLSTVWRVSTSTYGSCGVFVNALVSNTSTPTCALSDCRLNSTQTTCGKYTRGALKESTSIVKVYEVCYQ